MQASISQAKFRLFRWLAGSLFWLLAAGLVHADSWAPLKRDGVHDPRSPAAKLLQEPGDALSRLTPDTTGNLVRWVSALAKGEINPREKLNPDTKIEKLDKDILLNLKGGMPIVLFPHNRHTEWLACENCHDHLFQKQTGATKISMFNILQGEQCGVCHGAVAFPLTECYRCHSVTRPGQVQNLPKHMNEMFHMPGRRGP